MPGRVYNNGVYRYGYQGSEKSESCGCVNNYTTTYREMDSRIGRWWSIDPLAKEFPEVSAYVLNFNDPIKNVDPDGDCCFEWILKYNNWALNKLGLGNSLVSKTMNSLADRISIQGRITQVVTSVKTEVNQIKNNPTGYILKKTLSTNPITAPVVQAKNLVSTTTRLAKGVAQGDPDAIAEAIDYGAQLYVSLKAPTSKSTWVPYRGKLTIGPKTLARVTEHLKQFGKHAENDVMLADLNKIVKGEMKATEIHINFVKHELREADYMKQGLSPEKAHEAVLKEQGMFHKGYDEKLYTKEALEAGNKQMAKEAANK